MSHELTPAQGGTPNLPQPLGIQQRNQVAGSGANAEMQRVMAEVQAQVWTAKQFPRDQVMARQRIMQACDNISLAKDSTYSFSRGGSDVAGASIDLLTVIAANWCNIDFGVKEVARRPGTKSTPGESDVVAWAKDLETNTTKRMEWVVTHVRDTKRGPTILTDERDIYEAIANQGARRMRRCLEDIIPRDVVDDAVEACRRTMVANDVTPDNIKKLVDTFAKLGVSKAQIEARIQRKVDAIPPATYLRMREIYKSISDGMSETSDWFDTINVAAPVAAEEKPQEKTVNTSAEPAKEVKPDVSKVETQPSSDTQPPSTDMFKE